MNKHESESETVNMIVQSWVPRAVCINNKRVGECKHHYIDANMPECELNALHVPNARIQWPYMQKIYMISKGGCCVVQGSQTQKR